MWLDPVSRLELRKQAGIFLHHTAAIADPRVRGGSAHIVRHRFDEFRLIAVLADGFGQIARACKGRIKGARIYALR